MYSLVVAVGVKQNFPDATLITRERIQLTVTLDPGKRHLRTVLAEQPVRESKVRSRRVRLQL